MPAERRLGAETVRRLRGAFERLTTFEALWKASRRARRGKRRAQATALFEHRLEEELLRLQEELRSGDFRFSGYRTFLVREPALREIRAAPYRDRVVHHALCAELEPVIERHLIFDSYACRVGKGTHRALDRLQAFLRGGSWVVKVDVRKYFFSIDHGLLQGLLRHLISDPRLERLLERLLATYDAGPEYAWYPAAASAADVFRPRGLPIGNLTSQLFANYFLAPLDRFIKEELNVRRYLRYMDDMVMVAPDRDTARSWLGGVSERLAGMHLCPHPDKSQILPVKNGVRFLGFRVFPHHRRILRDNLQRFARRMRRYGGPVERGEMDMGRLRQSMHAWLGVAGGFVEQQCEQRPLCQPQQQQPVEPEQQQRLSACEHSSAGVRAGNAFGVGPERAFQSSPSSNPRAMRVKNRIAGCREALGRKEDAPVGAPSTRWPEAAGGSLPLLKVLSP